MPTSEEWLRKDSMTVAINDFGVRNSDETLTRSPQTASSAEKARPTVSIDTKVNNLLQAPSAPTAIPPKDQGQVAITILVACTILDSTTYGVLLSYGMFQEYYTGHFDNHKTASWIGVLSNGIVFLGAPVVTYCCQHFTLARKYYIWTGWLLCFLSLLVSAFVNVLPGLIVMQGLCYGIGALLVGIPELIILNTWFDKRRGLAYGIVFGGADLVGAGYTFLATALLHKIGLRGTLVIYAALTFCLAGPAIVVLRERETIPGTDPGNGTPMVTIDGTSRRRSSAASTIVPISRTKTAFGDLPFTPSLVKGGTWPTKQPKKRYYRRGIFYIFTLSNLLQACAAYLSFIYLPVFATQLGHSRETAALVLAIANIGMLFGDLGFGYFSDKIHVNTLILLSSGVSAVVTFTMWGLFGATSNSTPVLVSFAFIFGAFAGGFIVLWARMGTIFGEKDAAMVYSTMCFGRGLGGIVSGPISQVLLSVGTPHGLRAFNAGQYGSMVTFVGVCMTGSALLGITAMAALWWKKEQNAQIESGNKPAKERSWTW